MRLKRSLFAVLFIAFAFVTTGNSQDVIDPTTLNNKIMAGYQGWFGAPGDGSGLSWIHWGGPTINADNISFDMWPDLREYEADELFATDFVYSDLSNAGLFSSYTKKTVDRHVKWMKDYGIDGVFVQRFISSALSRTAQRDTVLKNVRYGAENHGRVFANMYDMSGGDPVTFVDDVINDWKHLVDDVKITESPNYLHHNGLPVLSLWGVHVGNSGSLLTPEKWGELLDWFTTGAEEKYRVTLKAGVGNGWKNDTQEWQAVYDKFEFLSPWSVGRYHDNSGADNFRNEYFQADLDETASRGMEYIPVVFPGFSWANLYEGKELNHIPRNGGDFLWHQMYNAIDAGCNMVYIAMFDEVDEGTAIFKIAENKSQIPTTGRFVTLDMDGIELPSDWYLKLAGEASKMLRGEIPITSTIPIVPFPNDAEFISQDVPTIVSPGATVSVSITMKNTGTITWTDTDSYALGSIISPDSSLWGLKQVDLGTGESVASDESKTFTFDITAPSTEGVYNFEWKMNVGGEWIGDQSDKRLINVTDTPVFLDDCDDLTDWNSSTSLSLNGSDMMQGSNCIEFTGGSNDDDEFNKVFASPYNAGITPFDAVIQFWYYISDASLAGNGINVGIGSGGEAGVDEYTWSVDGLSTGWNLVTLDVSDANLIGLPDLNAINWFSLSSSKTGSITSRIDEIQILDKYAGATRYTLTVTNGTGGGVYAEGAIIDIYAMPAPAAQEFIGWTMDGEDVLIGDVYAEATSISMPARDAEVEANYKVFGIYLDDCDLPKDWGGSGIISLNSTDQQEGLACLEFNGSATDEFKKVFSTPYNSGAAAETSKLQFWYYVSDASLFQVNNQVEIGSAGGPDQDEYSWSLSGLVDGWNLLSLNISEAGVIGAPDLTAINWFRLYHFKDGDMTTRIDAIEIVDPAAGDRYPLTVYFGGGDGNYYAGTEITIVSDPPSDGMLFDQWVIESGTPLISNLGAATTTLITASEASVITASYREVLKYTVTINGGYGDGTYLPGTTIIISAEPAPQGMMFDKWIVELGNAVLSNENAGLTYFTMPEEDVVITASLIDDPDYVSVNNINSNDRNISVYPNPAKDIVKIGFTLEKPSDIHISMLDLSGRIIGKQIQNINTAVGSHVISVPVSSIKAGTYLIKIKIDGEVITRLAVIQ